MVENENNIIRGVRFDTDLGATVAWMATNGIDGGHTLMEACLAVLEQGGPDWGRLCEVQKAYLKEINPSVPDETTKVKRKVTKVTDEARRSFFENDGM